MKCQMIMQCYEVFRGWMLEWTELYVDNYITIQSVASSCMLKSGCYDHAHQLSGVLQQYISKCVVGGRVKSATNNMDQVANTTSHVDVVAPIHQQCISLLACRRNT